MAVAALVALAACTGCTPPEETAPAEAPSIAAGEPCPRAFADETVLQGCLTEARGDFDGDGRADLATVFAELGRDDMPVAWWLIVELTSDGDVDTSQRLRPGDAYPQIERAADTDEDGRDEVLVEIGGDLEVFAVDEDGLNKASRN